MPAEAEMHFLENVKKLSMYGVDLHHAKVKNPSSSLCTVKVIRIIVFSSPLHIDIMSALLDK